jgi:hypothetical protein
LAGKSARISPSLLALDARRIQPAAGPHPRVIGSVAPALVKIKPEARSGDKRAKMRASRRAPKVNELADPTV